MSKIHRTVGLAAIAVLVVLSTTATAGTVIPGALSITGETEFFEDAASGAFVSGDAEQGGDFGVIEGGSTTTSHYDDDAVTSGSNPVPGTFTEFGDGFTLMGAADSPKVSAAGGAGTGEYFGALDFYFDIENTSSDAWSVTFKVDLTTLEADADGSDAWASSSFYVADPDGDVLVLDFLSDTLFGDEVDGVLTGGFGAAFSASGMTFFTVTVAPGATETVFGYWEWEGGALISGDKSHAELVTTVTIDSARSLGAAVPLPGAAWLGLGMLGLMAGVRRLRRR